MLRISILALASLALSSSPAAAQDDATPKPASQLDVTYGDGRVAARLVQQEWNPDDPRPTCKVFHHVFAPDGTLLTKGLGGQFEHHRGLFVGWNRTKVGDQTFDFWHCNKGERQTWGGTVSPMLLGMGERAQVSFLYWVAPDGKPVVHELRGLEVVAHGADHYVLHLRVQLRTMLGGVQLGGDPQHAGQQFRALQQFAEKDAAPVLYVRPQGAEDHGNDVWTGCDWIAAVLRLPAQTYTVLRIESPHNPGTTTWSTRPYGRFGATRTVALKQGEALRIDQLYVVATGARDGGWCAEQAEQWRQWPGLAVGEQAQRGGENGGK